MAEVRSWEVYTDLSTVRLSHMSQDIRDFVSTQAQLVGLGEPSHAEPAFGWVRNELFAQLVARGFRSFALETDRVAALVVDDFVQGGEGTLDTVLRQGFTHGFGDRAPNRELVGWMREYNRDRPAGERLAFHGFDAQTENTSAPSPRRYLEYARDYLGLDVDIAGIAGDDEWWSREEAILDAAKSPGTSVAARRLRSVGADLLGALHARAGELIAATSRAAWVRAGTYLAAGLGLLRYHKRAAEPGEQGMRITRLLAVRDGLMARNLLDIRDIEAERGPTLVHAHNGHLQKNPATLSIGEYEATWIGAGAIVNALLGESYAFVATTLGRSGGLELGDPAAGTYEALVQGQVDEWGLLATEAVAGGVRRADGAWSYEPLGPATVLDADAIVHIADADVVRAELGTA